MTFSEKLLRLRKQEGLSQEDLALYLNVSRQAVSRREQGTAMPDAGNLLRLRQRFDVSVDWMLDDEQGWETAATLPKTEPLPVTPVSPPWKNGWVIPLGCSLLGLLALGIFCSLHPGTYETAVAVPFGASGYQSRVYTGLFGSLKCYRLEWLFWLCVVIAAVSLGAWLRQMRKTMPRPEPAK